MECGERCACSCHRLGLPCEDYCNEAGDAMNATVSNVINEHVQNMRARIAFEMLREHPMLDPASNEDAEGACAMLEDTASAMIQPFGKPKLRVARSKEAFSIAAGAMDACAANLADMGEYEGAAWVRDTACEWMQVARS